MKYRLVVIGASLGGLNSLRGVLSALPGTFRPAVAIVQHRSADADDTLQFLLQKECAHLVREVEDKEAIVPGKIYLAPGGYHLMVEENHFVLSMEASVNYAQPSIDLLFKTAAEYFGSRVIGVVLTGTGRDGALGLAEIERCGGVVLIESRRTAVAQEMPEAAIEATLHPIEIKLEEIGPYLVKLDREQETK
jgi:two-component system, chemotaxis family, protein-glutamate methylesterase/glutaminase